LFTIKAIHPRRRAPGARLEQEALITFAALSAFCGIFMPFLEPRQREAWPSCSATARCSYRALVTPEDQYGRRHIHADQVAQENADLERRLLERLDELSTPFTEEDWAEIRSEVRWRLARKRKGR
jgi:hypothetical protein